MSRNRIEIRVPYEEIQDKQLIRRILERKFKERGLDMHRHEVTELIDDDARKERILKVKATQYHIL